MQGCTLLVFCRASPADLLLSCVPMVASGKAERFGAKKEAKKHPPPPRPPPIWGGCKQKFAETVKFFYVLVSRDDAMNCLTRFARFLRASRENLWRTPKGHRLESHTKTLMERVSLGISYIPSI